MTDVFPEPIFPPTLSEDNERSLTSLKRVLTHSRGRFALVLVRCNYHDLRVQVRQRLRQDCPIPMREEYLPTSTRTLSSFIEAIHTPSAEHESESLPALSIRGLDQVEDLDGILSAANHSRDGFHGRFSFPLILWVTDAVLSKMIRLAPDFYNWASSPISFRPSASELMALLHQRSHQLWQELLVEQSELFQPLTDEETASKCDQQRQEVDAALLDLEMELELDETELEPELRGSLRLTRGREQFLASSLSDRQQSLEPAIAHYQDSLDIWQTHAFPIRAGVVEIHLGLCDWRRADYDRANQMSHWRNAEHHFRQALAAFESSDRPQLKARFIGYLGETLKRLQDWPGLATVVEDAIALHQTKDRRLELAQDYGFKAELCLQQTHDPESAKQYAQQALTLLDQLLNQRLDQRLDQSGQELAAAKERGLFLLLLAQAERELGQVEAAIAHLRDARRISDPQNNPLRYIKILGELRSLYFEQKEYKTAFNFKRESIAKETQYGFRAFIGAGRLQPKRSAIAIGQPTVDDIAPEIAVSGRQQDVDKLKERIIRDRHRLTILHGPLGVGKSSILQAGLIPALRGQRVDTRQILVVMTRTYTNCQWAEKLGEEFSNEIKRAFGVTPSPLTTADDILAQIQQNHKANLVTVLIFDQFEEFFFNCQDIGERRTFFNALSQCLEIPFVNVILSLREDYLHYLLEWERYESSRTEDPPPTTPIYHNILSQEHRYALGNFSPTDAKNTLNTLTERAQFYMEEELRDRVVQDLTVNGEVKPIELQVIGVQLQSENITTIDKYQTLGKSQKEILVQKYLENIIQDCGEENRNSAELILYVLTDDNNTRPPRTRHEIEAEIQVIEENLINEVTQIDLILYIFQRSGLIFLIPELPSDRYQLVHDYLVSFIRDKKPIIERMAEELKSQREENQLLKFERNRERENHKKEIYLKNRNKRRLIYIFTLFLLFIGLLNPLERIRRILYSYEIRKIKRKVAILYIMKAEDLLNYENNLSEDFEQVALIELIKSAKVLSNLEEEILHIKHYRKLEEKIKVMESFQNLFRTTSLHKSSNDPGLYSEIGILVEQNYQVLNHDELTQALSQWIEYSCRLIGQEELDVELYYRRLKIDNIGNPCYNFIQS